MDDLIDRGKLQEDLIEQASLILKEGQTMDDDDLYVFLHNMSAESIAEKLFELLPLCKYTALAVCMNKRNHAVVSALEKVERDLKTGQ